MFWTLPACTACGVQNVVHSLKRRMCAYLMKALLLQTSISSTMDAFKVSNMLDRLYSKFDGLSEEMEVYKVETIGDGEILEELKSNRHCTRSI